MHRYASNNQKLCWAAVAAIETGNATALGSVMNDAQQVALSNPLFNPYLAPYLAPI